MKITLKDVLESNGKSQYRVSQDTGIPASTISNLCNNKTTRIDFSVLEKICRSVPCTPNDIFKIEDDSE